MKDYTNQTIIYTKPECPFCIKAKELLVMRGTSFVEIIIDGVTVTKQSMNEDLGQTGLNTVPQIVLDGEFIPGGYTGLKAHLGS